MESDFSAIHRIDDMYELSGPRFFNFANRMAAYKGVIRARLENEANEDNETSNSSNSEGDGYISLSRTRVGAGETDPTVAALNVTSKKPGETANLIDYSNVS